MKRWLTASVLFLVFALFIVPCTGCEPPSEETAILVNIQVTGSDTLKPMMDELDSRGIRATIWLSGEEMSANCEYVGELSKKGHEVAGKYPGEIKPESSYEDQKAELLAVEETSPKCTGQKIAGFRATKFTANDYTYKLLDEFGIKYLLRSARDELLSVYTFKPYMFEGHSFAILPMPIRCAYGESGSLCDTSAKGDLSPEQLREYMCAAIDNNIKLGEPLMLEWHPGLTNPDDTEGWWATFIAVLDYLETKGDNIKFVTAEEIVDYYPK